MVEASNLSSALSFLVGCVGLIVLWALYSDYRNDALRDRLFALRDEMFLYGHEQDILSLRAYKDLRLLMNSMIRYAHQVSLTRLLLLAMAWSSSGMGGKPVRIYEEWKAAVNELPEPQQNAIHQYHIRAQALYMEHMIRGCPIFWPILAFFAIRRAIFRVTRHDGGGPSTPFMRRMPSITAMEADALRAAA